MTREIIEGKPLGDADNQAIQDLLELAREVLAAVDRGTLQLFDSKVVGGDLYLATENAGRFIVITLADEDVKIGQTVGLVRPESYALRLDTISVINATLTSWLSPKS